MRMAVRLPIEIPSLRLLSKVWNPYPTVETIAQLIVSVDAMVVAI